MVVSITHEGCGFLPVCQQVLQAMLITQACLCRLHACRDAEVLGQDASCSSSTRTEVLIRCWHGVIRT